MQRIVRISKNPDLIQIHKLTILPQRRIAGPDTSSF
jgi:hypothetical protein